MGQSIRSKLSQRGLKGGYFGATFESFGGLPDCCVSSFFESLKLSNR